MFIDGSNLTRAEKLSLAKIVRTKLSNYDQALLALNVMSHFGFEWEARGIVQRYKPFANVPQHFFGIESKFSIKDRFPDVAFEWEGAIDKRPTYRSFGVDRWTVTLRRSPT